MSARAFRVVGFMGLLPTVKAEYAEYGYASMTPSQDIDHPVPVWIRVDSETGEPCDPKLPKSRGLGAESP